MNGQTVLVVINLDMPAIMVYLISVSREKSLIFLKNANHLKGSKQGASSNFILLGLGSDP